MFLNVISMFTAICWCTSYAIILGCNKYREAFNPYFLYMVFHSIVAILIDLNSQKLIDISFFQLVATYI